MADDLAHYTQQQVASATLVLVTQLHCRHKMSNEKTEYYLGLM